MAGTVKMRNHTRRTQTTEQSSRFYTYTDGTAVRKVAVEPELRPQEIEKQNTRNQIRKTRERSLRMNLGYVAFITVAAVIALMVCVNFLQLQAKGTLLQKEVTALETKLDSAILKNKSDYQRIMTSVDMQQIKDIAINELGMTYAKKSQVITYEIDDRDYVRQYAEVPTE